jgi:cation/acetate symporter
MGADAIFALKNPAVVSVPLGFLACYVGSVIGSRKYTQADEAKYTQIFVQANTGVKEVG